LRNNNMSILRFPKIFAFGERSSRSRSVGLQRIPDDLEFARQLADGMSKRMDPAWQELVAQEQGKRISITLPWPSAAQCKAGHDREGNPAVAEQNEFRQQVAQQVLTQHVNPLPGHLKLTIAIRPPDNCRTDMGSLAQQIEDALQHAGVLADANQIADIRLLRSANGSPGGIDITIEEV